MKRITLHSAKEWNMSPKSSLIAAALLSLCAGTALAQENANPPPASKGGQGMDRGMMGPRAGSAEDQSAKERGIVGLVLSLEASTVGAPAHLAIRRVEPYSPAYNAGVARGDQIAAVDGQSLAGKSLDDVATMIRGDVGTPVKLTIDHRGQSREISLTRVEPLSDHGHRRGGMMGGGMMGGGMMGMHGGMMGGQPPNSQFRKPSQEPQGTDAR
jgi:hypothetical protein